MPVSAADVPPSGADRLTVIVPAHNEEVAVVRCLRALLRQDVAEPFQVVVVANGCTDETAAVARALSPAFDERGCALLVLERALGNKPAALNDGDAHAVGGVRAYLDADAELSPSALGQTLHALRSGDVLICAPRIEIAPSGRWWTDGYGTVWSSLPYVRETVMGAGCYALGPAGRARWGDFPDVLSDDKFVRLLFAPGEQRVLTSTSMTTYLPTSLRQLVGVRARWCRGNRQLRHAYPELGARRERTRVLDAVAYLTRHPDLWAVSALAATVYAAGLLLSLVQQPAGTERWTVATTSAVRLEDPPADGAEGMPGPRSGRTTGARAPSLGVLGSGGR